MRLAITKSGFYHADVYCSESRLAKKILREQHISILAIDYYLSGRETGSDVIRWAHSTNLLPDYVVLIERDREKRNHLASSLHIAGFRSNDNTTFIKTFLSP